MKALSQNHRKTFGRSQVTALLATAVDFGLLLILVEIVGLYYVGAVALAAAAGAVANYVANRMWAFESIGAVPAEVGRYVAVSTASLGWNVLLVWAITEQLGIVYLYSKVIVAILVGVLWNYPMHKYWVFLANKEPDHG